MTLVKNKAQPQRRLGRWRNLGAYDDMSKDTKWGPAFLLERRRFLNQLELSKHVSKTQKAGGESPFVGWVCMVVSTPAIVASVVVIMIALIRPRYLDHGGNGYSPSNPLHVVSNIAARLIYSAATGTAISFYLQRGALSRKRKLGNKHLERFPSSVDFIRLLSILILFSGSIFVICNIDQAWAMQYVMYTGLLTGSASVCGLAGLCFRIGCAAFFPVQDEKSNPSVSPSDLNSDMSTFIYSPYQQNN